MAVEWLLHEEKGGEGGHGLRMEEGRKKARRRKWDNKQRGDLMAISMW